LFVLRQYRLSPERELSRTMARLGEWEAGKQEGSVGARLSGKGSA